MMPKKRNKKKSGKARVLRQKIIKRIKKVRRK